MARYTFTIPSLFFAAVSLSGCGSLGTGINGASIINDPTKAPTTVTTVTSDTTPPSVPAGLSASPASDTTINLTWQASTDPAPDASGVQGYFIYRNGTKVNSIAVTDVSYSDASLTATTAYKYEVSAIDVAGNESAKSASVVATTLAAPDKTPPTVPTGLSAISNAVNQISLTWTASTDPAPNVSGIQGYSIYRNSTLLNATPWAQTTYIDSTVSSGTNYTYYVVAVDNAGNKSTPSGSVSATAPCVDAMFADLDADCDGYSVAHGDCDDHDPTRHPGAADTWANGIDLDCKPDVVTCTASAGVTSATITLDANNYEPYTVMAVGYCPGTSNGLTGSNQCSLWPNKGWSVEKLSAVRFRINVQYYDIQGRRYSASCDLGD